MNPRGTVSTDDAELIRAALKAKADADTHLRAVIRDVATRSSVREIAATADLSTNTITRWKRGD